LEVDSTLADCFAQLLQQGLLEEHKFAAGLLDYLLNYLTGKITKQNCKIQKESIITKVDLTQSEEGEIVVPYDELPPVKVEIMEDVDEKDPNILDNGDLTETGTLKDTGKVEPIDVREDIIDSEGITKKVTSKEKPKDYAENHKETNVSVNLNDKPIKSRLNKEILDNKIGNEPINTEEEMSSVKGEVKPPKEEKMLRARTRPQMSYSCDYCTFTLGLSTAHPSFKMRRHKTRKHHVCEFCKEKHESSEHLDNHITSVHTSSSGGWVCGTGDCKVDPPYTWSKKDELLGHVRMVHEKVTYHCAECGQSYRDKRRHKKYHTADPKDILSCSYCEFFTLSNHTLKFHKKREHPEEGGKKDIPGKLSCDSCSFVTNGRSPTAELEAMRLIIHKRIHREGNIVCDKCEFATKKKFSFQRHLSDKHNLGERYACTICDYSTGGHSGKGHLKIHMERHNTEKSYMCDKCEYKSSCQRSLKQHLQTHEETPRFLCDGCDYTSNDYSNFLAHNRTKHGDTMSCDNCDFTTKSDRTMRNHKSKHSTSLACGECDFKTNSLQALRCHKTSKSHGSTNENAAQQQLQC